MNGPSFLHSEQYRPEKTPTPMATRAGIQFRLIIISEEKCRIRYDKRYSFTFCLAVSRETSEAKEDVQSRKSLTDLPHQSPKFRHE